MDGPPPPPPPPTPLQFALAGYLPLVSGNLSVIGSSLIVYSILGPAGRRAKKLHKPHIRLLLGMSVIDIFYSFFQGWTVLFSPRGEGMPGAIGNMATCRMQGFFVQMAHSTAAYNAALSTYYWLTVCRGLKVERWLTIEPYLHAIIVSLNVVLGTIGVATRLYNPNLSNCYIATYPAGCEMGPGAPPCKYYSLSQMNLMYELFANMWVQAYVIIVFFTSFALWYKVHRQEAKVRRYGEAQHQQEKRKSTTLLPSMASRLGVSRVSRASSGMERSGEFSQSLRGSQIMGSGRHQQQRQERREVKRNHQVFVQCVLYAGSFLLCWIGPVMFHLIGWVNNYQSFAFVMVIVLFTPLQGFFNAFAYGRPTFSRVRRKYPHITRWEAFKRVFFAEDPMKAVCPTDYNPNPPTTTGGGPTTSSSSSGGGGFSSSNNENDDDDNNNRASTGRIVDDDATERHNDDPDGGGGGGGSRTKRDYNIDEDNDFIFSDSDDDDDEKYKDDPNKEHKNPVRAALEQKASNHKKNGTSTADTTIADETNAETTTNAPTMADVETLQPPLEPPSWIEQSQFDLHGEHAGAS